MSARWSIEHGMCVRRVGDGPELVWIHGLGEWSGCFDATVAALPGYTHVLPDLPGYGRSPWPAEPASLDELASVLARWIGERDPAIVIGHSMGGVLATLVAERTLVRAVIDIEGNVSSGDCTFSLRAAAMSRDAFAALGLAELRADVYAEGAASSALRGYAAALVFASPDAFHRHSVDLIELSARGDLAHRLVALGVPTLYVAGGSEGICAHSRELLDRAGARWIALEPAGHWVYVDRPAEFTAAVREFLRGPARE
jgi:3-oxoadipate enol-lactonase